MSQLKNPSDRDCLLVLDEVSIVPKLCYDSSTGSFLGKVTLPEHNNEELATHVLVFMLTGISRRWKQVVDFYYTGKSTNGAIYKLLMINYIKKAHEIGLDVHGIVSDMGSANQALWRSFEIIANRFSVTQNRCQHPVNQEQYLYFFHDASHAFKNLKEGLLNNDVIKISDEFVAANSLPSNTASSKHLQHVLLSQEDSDFKLAPKLRSEYFDRNNHFQKMRVKSASHVLSKDVSATLEYLAEEQNLPELKTTSWLIKQFSKWFKIMSSRNLSFALSKRNKTKFEETIEFLSNFLCLMSSLSFGIKSDWKPFQKGIIISTSFIQLTTFLLDRKDYVFVLGGRFTQDCLENLFSIVFLTLYN